MTPSFEPIAPTEQLDRVHWIEAIGGGVLEHAQPCNSVTETGNVQENHPRHAGYAAASVNISAHGIMPCCCMS